MSRVQLALRVAGLETSVAFYAKLLGTQPAELRPGYADFAVAEPPFRLVLIQGARDEPTALDRLGIEVESTEQVTEAATRLTEEGLRTISEEDAACCYALEDKVWAFRPGNEPWEVFAVKGDADSLCEEGFVCCSLDRSR